jgi:hypothetical protein
VTHVSDDPCLFAHEYDAVTVIQMKVAAGSPGDLQMSSIVSCWPPSFESQICVVAGSAAGPASSLSRATDCWPWSWATPARWVAALSAVEGAASTAMEGSASEPSDYGREWSVTMADLEIATETALIGMVGAVLRNVTYTVHRPVELLAEVASNSNGGKVDVRGGSWVVYMASVELLAALALSGTDRRPSAGARRAALWYITPLENVYMTLLSQCVTIN